MRFSIQGLLTGIGLLLLSTTLIAENSTSIPGYTIHHNALLTSDLEPDVAKSYGIRRSTNRAMLNVSIIKDVAGTTGEPAAAKVTATGKNTRGQIRNIPLREIKETDAIYYIGDFLVENHETVDFTIEVTPEGESQTHTATIQQQFFTK
jgi:hypothetical protein